MNADGFTLTWTKNDAVQTEILYLAMAPMTNTAVRLISFTAAKYDSGVLLQWRTGYEIDNLGFNLYREINDVASARKVNASLIAGSGLQAGQGGVVRTPTSYARWDLDPAASDPTVRYWLEDVEFNGKSKLHGPVYARRAARCRSRRDSDDSRRTRRRRRRDDSRADLLQLQRGPGAARPARRAGAGAPPEVTRQWALAAQPTVKMGIRKPGWYRVTQRRAGRRRA